MRHEEEEVIVYNFQYNHQTKEVTGTMQVGLSPPAKFLISAEAFIQDVDFLKRDKNFVRFLADVRERKDLPTDHDFGPGGGQIKFNPRDWESKKEGEND